MKKATRFVGLDVHAETIAVAVAEPGRTGELKSLGTIPNRPEAINKLMKRLGGTKDLLVCYEAGPTGYVLYWQLTKLGIECEVVAPTLVPEKVGDRVKTDRRDAMKLARCLRAGELTTVWVPDPAHEALRDLVRAREAAKKDQLRARNRLSKFLLRAGRRPPDGTVAWSANHRDWLRAQKFEHPARQSTMVDYLGELDHVIDRVRRLEQALDDALEQAPPVLREIVAGLQALRGVAKLTATTLAVEIGNFSRFDHPTKLMGYAGITPSEYSTGKSKRKGAITKAGNSHLRRVLVEAAWAYRHRPAKSLAMQARTRKLPAAINEIGWKAQHRLCRRYASLQGKENRSAPWSRRSVESCSASSGRSQLTSNNPTRKRQRRLDKPPEPSRTSASHRATERRRNLDSALCGRPALTRAASWRQLPTDHDHAAASADPRISG